MTTPQLLDLSNPRYWHQNAQMAVRDVYDALVELITNADDRYVFLHQPGRIEIEVERRRKDTPSIIRVRDFADGMTLEVMRRKLARLGDRVSGMAEGLPVRGTNSRGAKDVAVMGGVVFESVVEGRYHRCEITERGYFSAADKSPRMSKGERESLGILSGTGTVVTLSVSSDVATVPQHDKMTEQLSSLVVLRDILSSPDREVVLIDLNRDRQDIVKAPQIEGRDVLKERLVIPDYPHADAKLIIRRATRRLESGRSKFREGGILIKSQHAIHEATLFAPELEHDPHAAWFFGRLTCGYIEHLANDYDDRFERGLKPSADNALPIVDPLRKAGVTRDHPFIRALFGAALKHLRPLVEEERRQRETKHAEIEDQGTRRRLRALEKEATKFLDRYLHEDEAARDPNEKTADAQLRQKGFSFSPPFAQVVVGQSLRYWLNVRQDVFPELAVGDPAELTCASTEISCGRRVVLMETHPSQEGVIRAVWVVRGELVTPATEVTVRLNPIVAASSIEVLAEERDKYSWVDQLTFGAKRYRVRVGSSRQVAIYAPCPSFAADSTLLKIDVDQTGMTIGGEPVLRPRPEWGVLVCKLRLTADKPDRKGTVTASALGRTCTAQIETVEALGTSIKIAVRNVDHVNQRYRWRGNVLEIAAKHPSLRRYLGPPDEFPGQGEKHFRVLLAEIVAEAVCALLISKNASARPDEYQDYDWENYYADYTKLMTEFLPIAHASQVSDP